MQTATLTETRSEIFRRGLTNATGVVTYWRPEGWGTISLDGPIQIECFVHRDDFPKAQRRSVGGGSRVQFMLAACQAEQKDRKPRANEPKLISNSAEIIGVSNGIHAKR